MKRYPVYKDSGVEWLGEIPGDWVLKRFKHLLKRNKGAIKTGPFGSQLKGQDFVESGIKVYNQRTVLDNNFKNGEHFITEEKYKSLNGFEVVPNDILITSRGTIGKCAIVPEDAAKGVLHPCLIRLQADTSVIYNEYLRLFIQESNHFKESVQYESDATTIEVIYSDTLKNVKIPLPSTGEQKLLMNFLDHKTRLIDTLIEKKQKQIELLQEQRTGIINQAVTKGLNPNARMKDSGIEWLGEVPEHWEVKRLKHISKIRYGLGQPPKEQNDGLPLIRATNIKRGRIVENGMIYISPDDVPYDRNPVLNTEDIVVVRSGAYTADSAIIPEKYDGAIVGYDMVVKSHAAISKFLSYCLLSHYVLNSQLFLKRLRAAQPHLNAEELGDTFILIPPDRDEQKEILGFIELKSNQIENLIAKAEKQVEVLREYRTTLISEAVTGEIDIRDEAIP